MNRFAENRHQNHAELRADIEELDQLLEQARQDADIDSQIACATISELLKRRRNNFTEL